MKRCAFDAVCFLFTQIKKQQQKIEMILDSKKIPYEKVDISADEAAKTKMRAIVGNPSAVPPQLCNGDQYCGVSTVSASQALLLMLNYGSEFDIITRLFAPPPPHTHTIQDFQAFEDALEEETLMEFLKLQ